jgi:hypothetical protein
VGDAVGVELAQDLRRFVDEPVADQPASVPESNFTLAPAGEVGIRIDGNGLLSPDVQG